MFGSVFYGHVAVNMKRCPACRVNDANVSEHLRDVHGVSDKVEREAPDLHGDWTVSKRFFRETTEVCDNCTVLTMFLNL